MMKRWTNYVLAIIVVIALLFIISGFNTGFNRTFEKILLLGGHNLETFSEDCQKQIDVSRNKIDLKVAHCSNFEKVKLDSGEKRYINCGYSEIMLEESINCNVDSKGNALDKSREQAFCEERGQEESFKLNDGVCSANGEFS